LALPIIILAGGLGTRLGQLSQKTPKALMPVADEPFIFHQLRLLKDNSLEKVIICAGYLGERIEEAVGDGRKFGLNVDYSYDWPNLLGTGGAIRLATQKLEEPFMVLYGDSYLDLDYQGVARAFLSSQKPALMTVYHNEGKYDRSNVIFEAGVIRLYDKKNPDPAMKYIDYGLSCLTRDIIADGPVEEVFDLAEIMTKLSRQGDLAGFEVKTRFHEIGSPESLAELDAFLRRKLASNLNY
jgi:NDP-sugar pyrophosphorylase family protein